MSRKNDFNSGWEYALEITKEGKLMWYNKFCLRKILREMPLGEKRGSLKITSLYSIKLPAYKR